MLFAIHGHPDNRQTLQTVLFLDQFTSTSVFAAKVTAVVH